MKISVIIPAYNIEKYISECIESVLNQNFSDDYEVIIVDDGSTDNTVEEINKYNQKNVKTIHQKNAGLSAARNTGIDKAAGEYIAFIDGDDIISEDFLSVLYDSLIDNSSDIAICGIKEFCDKTPQVKTQNNDAETVNGEDATIRLLIGQENQDIIVCNKLYKKELFKNIRFPEGKLHEDNLTTYKLFGKTKNVSTVQEDLYFYRKRKGSIMAEQDIRDRLEIKEQAAKEAIEYFEGNQTLKDAAEVSFLLSQFAFLDNVASGKIKNQELWRNKLSNIKNNRKKFSNNPLITKKLKIYLTLIKIPVLYKIFRKIRHE